MSLLVISKLRVTCTIKRYLLKMCHLRHRLRIFLFHRKVMSLSRDIQVFVFLTNLWSHKTISTRGNNLLQLLNNQLCQVSSVSFFRKSD